MQQRTLSDMLAEIEGELRRLAGAARAAAQLADTPPPPTPTAEVVWLDTDSAAAHLGISAAHLRRLVSEGKVPAHRLPGGVSRLRFRVDELNATMQQGAKP